MSPAKTTTERVEALRANRERLGLKRRELYATDAEWIEVQKLMARLIKRRPKG